MPPLPPGEALVLKFSHKNDLKFSEKVGIFQKINDSPKKGVQFLLRALDTAFT